MKFPFSFDLKFVFRLLLPGFILSLGLLPIIHLVVSHFGIGNVVSVESIFLVMVLVIGWLFVIFDMHIYMLFEGRRYWPSFLKEHFISLQNKRLMDIKRAREEIREKTRNETCDELKRKEEELSQELRYFPITQDKHEYYAKYPTRLGNLIVSYETYPKERYGMDSVFYWYRIWLSLSKDVREEIDGKQALVDSTIYVSVSCTILSLLCLMYGIVKLCNTNFAVSFSAGDFFLLSFISLVFSYLIYLGSLELHKTYGEIFKAMFDMHRKEVDAMVDEVADESAKEIGERTNDKADNKTKKEKYEIVWAYLQYYRVKKDGKYIYPWELEEEVKEGNPKPVPAKGG